MCIKLCTCIICILRYEREKIFPVIQNMVVGKPQITFVTHPCRCALTRCLLSASDVFFFILLHKIKKVIFYFYRTLKCFDLYIRSSTNVFLESVGARCSDNMSWQGAWSRARGSGARSTVPPLPSTTRAQVLSTASPCEAQCCMQANQCSEFGFYSTYRRLQRGCLLQLQQCSPLLLFVLHPFGLEYMSIETPPLGPRERRVSLQTGGGRRVCHTVQALGAGFLRPHGPMS